MRDEFDCMNCYFYRYDYKHKTPICNQDKKVVEWDGDFNWDDGEDENFGAYRVNDKNERMSCELFRLKGGNKRGDVWRGEAGINITGKKNG